MGLQELRKAKGYTLEELARRSGLHYMKIHQIEHEKIKIENITLRNALRLAAALECEPKDLI